MQKKYDIHLGGEYLKKDWNGGFEGCSGSPLVINGYISGIVVKEENSPRDSPLKAISITTIKLFLEKNFIDVIEAPIIQTEKSELKKYCYVPIATAEKFYYRDTKLDEINDIFKRQSIAVIRGMSGVGKTQLAIQYINKYRSQYNLIFFVRADKKVNIVNDYIILAKCIEIYNDEQKTTDIIFNVINWLYNNNNWLIVFDNVEEFSEMNNYIPDNNNNNNNGKN